MDADDLVDAINDSHNNAGPVYVHVVDRDHEYWLEVTEIKDTNLIEVPWANGILIETKPIADGVRARKDIFTPRPFFAPAAFDSRIEIQNLGQAEALVLDTTGKSYARMEIAAQAQVDGSDQKVPIIDQKITIHTPLHGRMYEPDEPPADVVQGEVEPGPYFQDGPGSPPRDVQAIMSVMSDYRQPLVPDRDQSEPHYWTYETPEYETPDNKNTEE